MAKGGLGAREGVEVAGATLHPLLASTTSAAVALEEASDQKATIMDLHASRNLNDKIPSIECCALCSISSLLAVETMLSWHSVSTPCTAHYLRTKIRQHNERTL